MNIDLTEARLAICARCPHGQGDRCGLLANWMSLATVACVSRNNCPAAPPRWDAVGRLQADAPLLEADLALCRWTDETRPGMGIVIGSDSAQEWLIPWFVRNLRRYTPGMPVMCADYGLSQRCLDWMAGNDVQRLAPAPLKQAWMAELPPVKQAQLRKPFAIMASPYEHTVWMDTDMEIRRDVRAGLEGYLGRFSIRIEPEWYVRYWRKKPAPHYEMLNAGMMVAPHGDELVVRWAQAICQSSARPIWERDDQYILTDLIYGNDLAFTPLTKEEHTFVIDHPQAINPMAWHDIASRGKDYIRERFCYPSPDWWSEVVESEASAPFLWMDPWEVAQMSPYVRNLFVRERYVEIGGNVGGSLAHFASMMEPGATLISVDMETKPELHEVAGLLQRQGFESHVIKGRGEDSVAAVQQILGGKPIDCLLVDADHLLPSVAVVAMAYAPLVRPGGLIVLHDCSPMPDAPRLPPGAEGMRFESFAVFQRLANGRRAILIDNKWGTGLVWM